MPWRHGLEEREPAPQEADAGRAAHLVPRRRDEVDAELLHVDRHVRQALAGVEQHERVDSMRRRDDLAHGGDAAERVGDVRERDQLRARRDQRLQRIEVEALARVERRELDTEASLLGQHLPRHQVGVVLHHGQDDLITLAQIRSPPRLRDQVDRLRRAPREDNL